MQEVHDSESNSNGLPSNRGRASEMESHAESQNDPSSFRDESQDQNDDDTVMEDSQGGGQQDF
jgi:hypothetical protein